MRANEPMVPALAGELHGHAKRLRKRLRRAQKGDPQGVHDARTTVRRLRLELDVLARHASNAAMLHRLEDRLHALDKVLGDIRDQDVLREDVRTKRGLRPLVKRLKRTRKKKQREGLRTMSKGRSLVRKVRRCEPDADLRLEPRAGKVHPVLVRHLGPEEIARAFDAVLAYETAPVDHESLHRFRGVCRRLRYLLELFEEAPADNGRIISELRDAQSQLGDLHDHHVAVLRIARWLEDGRLPHTPELEAYLVERVRADKRLLREAHEHRRKILGGAFRARVAAVLMGTPPTRQSA
ncbi:CHAD domain-containing protein [Pendulispora rubella]|uniref:CHAD domain-containing protein n=1 Tax=Pendulispora rubella TaxID=2741070 RepID=A0ABZ2LF75_9BACT